MKLAPLLCTLLLGLAPLAQAADTPSSPKEASRGDEMERAQCVHILDLFAAADPASKVKKEALAAAQDRAYVFVMWVHGYLSGRDGIDFARRPLNQEGVTQVVGEIMKACQPDESRLFLDAIRSIR